MMTLSDLMRRPATVEPWSEGDNIPWHEPGFSERMLVEHLSQHHDAASRRFDKIDAHVEWVHRHVLQGQATKVLDLACGPGLYASRLARRGHQCVGIDYSPASIAYAREHAGSELRCEYMHEDIREADYGSGFGLVMLISGELNAFRPEDARAILRKAHRALDAGGVLLLEPHTAAAIEKIGARGLTWYTRPRGVFSDQPHLCLNEQTWDAETNTATIRYYVIDTESAEVRRYAQSMQAYSDDEYRALLEDCGFEPAEFFPSLTDAVDGWQPELIAIVAHKRAS